MSEKHVKYLRVHALHLRLNDDEKELLDLLSKGGNLTKVVCDALRAYAKQKGIGPTEPNT